MQDLDEMIDDREDRPKKIVQIVREAFADGGKDAAVVAIAEQHAEIQTLSDVEWIRVKGETSSLHGMNAKDLAAIRKKNKLKVENGWMAEIELDSNGKIRGGLKNCNIILKCQDEIKGKIRFNDFLKRPCITGNVPFLRNVDIGAGGWCEIGDDEMSQLRSWLAMDFAEFGKDCLGDALTTVTINDSFNPLTDILDKCEEKWDRKPRLDGWLIDLCGADASDYVRAVGAKWMISAVARAYRAGCKVDTMLILEGKQGAKKSSFLSDLSFGYFLELLTDISRGKDVVDKMLGKWIIEMPELKALSGDREANKAFLTQQTDHERLSYLSRSKAYPRRCVFIGTTNEDAYLKDDTGERRYWPVKVGECNRDKLKECLHDLWGEAVVRFKAGENWWLEDEELTKRAEEVQADKTDGDEMEHLVRLYVESLGVPFHSIDIWKKVFEGQGNTFNKSNQMRVASILRRIGCKRYQKTKMWA